MTKEIYLHVTKFQSTLPRKERPATVFPYAASVAFQSTLPRRERPESALWLLHRWRSFNPRSHGGSDTQKCVIQAERLAFQSTLPRRERQGIQGSIQTCSCVSIHAPTKGATHIATESPSRYSVSIHAPTKGATPIQMSWLNRHKVSIHAPTKGATRGAG